VAMAGEHCVEGGEPEEVLGRTRTLGDTHGTAQSMADVTISAIP
jgi:hypothetical protein